MRLITAPHSLDVPFHGTRSGTFPLTWGQTWVWDSVRSRAPYYADLSGSYIVEVLDGCDLTAISGALTTLLDRYETFRSRYSLSPDGTPHQTVLAEGHLRVEVRDVDAADTQAAARTVENEFNNAPFTLPELSLRASVVTSGGVPRYVVLCAFHMAMDCHGMVPVLEDFRDLMSGKPADAAHSAPPATTHPADRALEERDTKGVQRSARGIRFWEQEIAKFPGDPLPWAGHRPEGPRYKTFAMHSAAVRVASLELAEALGVSTASVILAMTMSLLGRKTGNRMCGMILAASHRYDAESMRYPGTLVQGVPVAVDVSDGPPHDLISRTHRAGMLAALMRPLPPPRPRRRAARVIRGSGRGEAGVRGEPQSPHHGGQYRGNRHGSHEG